MPRGRNKNRLLTAADLNDVVDSAVRDRIQVEIDSIMMDMKSRPHVTKKRRLVVEYDFEPELDDGKYIGASLVIGVKPKLPPFVMGGHTLEATDDGQLLLPLGSEEAEAA